MKQRLAPALRGHTLGTADNDFLVAEWEEAPAPAGERRLIAPLHLHKDDDEVWYVLEGALGFQIGAGEVLAKAGTAVIAPKGTPHTYWNGGPTSARYLLIMTPAIHRLIEDLHSSGERDRERLAAVYAKHGSELL